MKRKNLLLMAGLAAFILTGSQAVAFDIEEDMAEGITLSVKKDEKDYKYDNAMPDSQESMTEFVFFPESKKGDKHFAGDPSCPSLQNLMAEGICLEHLNMIVAGR